MHNTIRQLLTALAVAAGASTATLAQDCILANPSFEVGNGLTGWNASGNAAITASNTVHGSKSVTLTGPFINNWGISAVWQPFPATAGSTFDASVHVSHPAANPLTGNARAILNIEWRDAADQLITYDTFEVLTPADPTDQPLSRTVSSSPAPPGTVTARLLLAVLQSPAQETSEVTYDLADFIEQTTPTFDESQWVHVIGGRVINFAGHNWRVKGDGYFGPGPNWFSDSASTVQVNGSDLRLAIAGSPGNWSSSEIILEDPLGYGDYVITTKGRLDLLAPNTVLGLFLWQYPACYDPANTWNQHNEIDVEISRWGDPNADLAQFVVQPYNAAGNITRFDIDYAANPTVTYAMRWLPDRIEYRCWTGGPQDESPASLLNAWTYTGQHLPRPEQPRLHFNLWHTGAGPSNNQPQHAVIDDFRFVPLAPPCRADTNADGVLDNGDIGAFVSLFLTGNAAADFNADGTLDNGDIGAFVTLFLVGC